MATPVLAVQALTKDDTIDPVFMPRLVDTGGVVLVHAERLGQRVQLRGGGDGAVLKSHAGGHGGGKGGIPAPGHVALPHKKEKIHGFHKNSFY